MLKTGTGIVFLGWAISLICSAGYICRVCGNSVETRFIFLVCLIAGLVFGFAGVEFIYG